MMSPVSGPSASDGNGRADMSENGAGVLANLPRTRPQRATARRAASRRSSTATVEKATAEPPAERAAAKARQRRPRDTGAGAASAKRASTRARKPSPIVDPAPRQGYECLEERATGSVQPPGGADLLNTAAEALSELAKAGLSGGERLLRDVLSRLPR